MPLLLAVLESFICTLAVWIIVLQAGSYLKAPIASMTPIFVILWMLMFFAMAGRRWFRKAVLCSRRELNFARDVVGLGCLVGILILVASRPDADDVGYMHQAMVDASSPQKPITVDPFVIPFPIQRRRIEIPLLSEREAYESLVVALASLAGVNPLQFYHNVFAFLAAILWVATYALLFRRLRVPRNKVWLALLATITFLLLDGNLHRTFGNLSLLRIWQGKVIGQAILLPAFTLLALRCLARPTLYRCSFLFVTTIVCYFVNRSLSFQLALLGTSLAIGYSLAFLRNRRRRSRALLLVGAVAPLGVLCACMAWFSLSPGSSALSMLSEIYSIKDGSRGISTTWWTSLHDLVVSSPFVLVRDIAFLTVLPILVVRRPLHRLLPLMSLSIGVLALSPFTGPVWYNFITRVYWRLYHVLPLPLCAGLLACLASPFPISRYKPLTRIALGAGFVAIAGFAIEKPTLSTANNVQLKAPFEFRFRSENLSFARSVAPHLETLRVLAPDSISTILALTEHQSIDLIYIRPPPRSAAMRANAAISLCRVNPLTARSLRQMLRRRADAMIMSSCGEDVMRRLRRLVPDFRFEEESAVQDSNFRLYWVHPATP